MRGSVTRAAEGFDRRAFTVDEVLRMQEAGIISEDENFELIEGEIVPMQAKTHAHELLKSALTIGVVKALPDGHTLLFVTSANATNPALYGHLNFNFLQDIAPVASIERQAYVMAVNPSFPANTVIDFIAYAKANSGGIAMASGGNGTLSQIAGELFKISTGANMVHVPYRGGQGPWTDLIGGQVQVYFGAQADCGEVYELRQRVSGGEEFESGSGDRLPE